MRPRLGSLFDGSGGFPLAGSLCGIEPKWAAEVEPYPIAVTRSRFPHMKHLGDISKVSGREIEPVDIITFGSPCQDLSVAGKRAGLKHEANGDDETTRSGLFMEAVRIIKEMREATDGRYPTFALWENVPGAFSSNGGEDFRTVLEELIRIVEPQASMPPVPKGGWNYADSFVGDGWSIAYRVFDAQYWGVPQRRRRIHLVLDLRGERAREVLFEREGVRGYFAQGRTPWQGIAADAQDSAEAADREIEGDAGGVACGAGGEGEEGLNAVIYGIDHAITTGGNCTAQGPCVYENVQATLKASGPHAVAYTLKKRSGCEGGGKGALIQTDKSATLATNNDQYLFQPCTQIAFCKGARPKFADDATVWKEAKVANTLNTFDQGETRANELVVQQYLFENHSQDARYKGPLNISPMLPAQLGTGGNNTPFVVESVPSTVYCLQGNGIDRADTAGCNGKGWKEDASYTLNTIDRPAVAYAIDQQGGKGGANYAEGVMPTLCSDSHGTPHAVAYCTDVGFFNSQKDVSPTLLARQYKDPHLVSYSKGEITYIVRRLTPTECARLQGFADRWGDIDEKDNFTPEEYRFWLEVRNTHAAINGRAVKDYTEAQMLTWYNKLHTDSAEYKMWGNGIALPPALYVLQGMRDVLTGMEDEQETHVQVGAATKMPEVKEAMREVKNANITKQERKTLRGQIIAGQIEGALKGLKKLLSRKERRNGN